MTRTIRPIGKVPPALKKHGYRQMAAILVDGKPVQNTLVLSLKEGDKTKFVGQFTDATGELHKTKPMFDMKKAASRIMTIREWALENEPKPAAKPKPAPRSDAEAVSRARRAAKRQPGGDILAGTDNLIDCPDCGTLHRRDTRCL